MTVRFWTGSRIAACLVAVTAIKLALAPVWGWTIDIQQTQAQAELFLAGRHTFSPFNIGHVRTIFPLGYYVLACGAQLLAERTEWPFVFWIKVPAILSDLGIAWLLLRSARGGLRAALWYMLNPVTWLLSVYHGQLHTVATAGAVLALWASERSQSWLTGIALGLGASVRQHFALLILPLALRAARQRVALLAGFTALVFLSNVTLWSGYAGRLGEPVWVYGAWGYGMALLQGSRLLALLGVPAVAGALEQVSVILQTYGPKLYWCWAGVFLVWVVRRWNRQPEIDVWRAALFLLVGHYAISPGFGVQWLIWAVPCWLIVDFREAQIFTLCAGAYLAGTYWLATLGARYHVASVTAELSTLQGGDLLGVCLVGLAGLATWVWCARATWRLAWER